MKRLDEIARKKAAEREDARWKAERQELRRRAEMAALAAQDAQELDRLMAGTLELFERAGAPDIRWIRVPLRGLLGTRWKSVGAIYLGALEFEWKDTTLTSNYFLTTLIKVASTAGLGGEFNQVRTAGELSAKERALMHDGMGRVRKQCQEALGEHEDY